MQPRVTTCCYCGRRDTLVLSGTTRHELACGGCGAPLHELHALKVRQDDVAGASGKKPKKSKKSKKPPHSLTIEDVFRAPRSRRGKKSSKRKLVSKAFDVLDDLFD